MTYNRDIRSFAPLPSGALPTRREIDDMVRKSRHHPVQYVLDGIRKVFEH